jgi:putative heme-binding domain-containing protein
MRPAFLSVVAGVLCAAQVYAENPNDPYAAHIAGTPPRTPADEVKAFHLPPGFEAQLVASEPDIHKPINIAFDDRGRLWLTESVEYPFAAKGHNPRDAVKILDDFDVNGRARKITTYADGLNIPIGILPLSQGALAYSIPNIYRLNDTKHDGHADERQLLLGSIGYRDTHGMTSNFNWGFDGWVYACHGYANTSTLRASDGSTVTMNSGNVYRFKPDGSHVEQFTHGQVNPFGLAFDPLGNLFSADCHTKPVMMLLRGGYYDSFGKPHDGLGYAPEMLDRYDDSTAIAGIAYYAADHYPAAFRDRVYIGDVVTHNIVQFDLEWHGSSPRAILKYFLKSDDPWFRPVDIKLGPDGALYVADFYNRIIGHYEVPLDHPGRDRERGRVWRIVYKGDDATAHNLATPRDLTSCSILDLVQELGNPNLAVRTRATNQLVERGGSSGVDGVRALFANNASATERVHGLWVLERRGVLDDALLNRSAKDADRVVRVQTLRILSERRDLDGLQRDLVLAGLNDADAFVNRAAADVLGQHPSAANVRPLLDLRQRVSGEDPQLLHTVRMALRNQLRNAAVWGQLPSPLSEADARAVADVAPGVPSAAAALYLLQHLRRYPEKGERLLQYAHHVARHGSAPCAPELLTFAQAQADLNVQVALYREIERGTQERGSRLTDAARTWAGELTDKLVASQNAQLLQSGIELAGTLKLRRLQPRLTALAGAHATPEPQRIAAVQALLSLDARGQAGFLGKIVADSAESIALREQTATALARVNAPETQDQLVQSLPLVPARLQTVIAVGLAGSRTGAEKLLEAIAAGKASARLLQDKGVELRLAETKLPDLQARVSKLTTGLPPADQRLQDLITRRRAGFSTAKPDTAKGAVVYEKSCAICHQLGGKGAKVGPQLDGIGARGVDRLLEDILDPNRNVDQAFRSTTLTLKNGQFVSGLLLREEGEVLVMADAQGKEVRVPKNTVEERSVSQLSPMPANLAEQIGDGEFYDLLAFLLTQRTTQLREKSP